MENMEKSGLENPSRREFIKKLGVLGAGAIIAPGTLFSQEQKESLENRTELKKTDERFNNGEYVYEVIESKENKRVGELWPIENENINLITKETNPELFNNKSLEDILRETHGTAIVPASMTTHSEGVYKMEGKSLSDGWPCGDGIVYNYGIIVVKNGSEIIFTHAKEIPDFNNFYDQARKEHNTLFFLPSIYREGKFIDSETLIEKALIKRKTTGKDQIGTILFDAPTSYNKAREIVLGLDRTNSPTGEVISKTTHIYVLDGGPVWGQSAKEVTKGDNKQTITKGTRNPLATTNYIIIR